MTTLEQRLQRIEDRFALQDLEADYAAHWDFGRSKQWAQLFTEEGYFEMLPAGPMPAFKATGHEDLAQFCDNINRNWEGLHLMHPARLTIQGDSASALIFFEFPHVMNDGAGHTRQGVTTGYYEVDYRRTSDGWRIEGRREQPVFDNTGNSFSFKRTTRE
jgi:hypothetical protein